MSIRMPERFDVIVFDFDGTLVFSNQLKEDAYLQVASMFNGGGEKLLELVGREPPIGDRYSLFKEFVGYAVSNQITTSLTENEIFDLVCIKYTELTFASISQAKARAGSIELLESLMEEDIMCFIISGTPQDCLIPILKARSMTNLFEEALGGPKNKYENLRILSDRYGIEISRFLIVGDGQDDFECASRANCGFIGVHGGSLKTKVECMIDSYESFQLALDACKPVS